MNRETVEEREQRLAEQEALWDMCTELAAYHNQQEIDLNQELANLERQRLEEALTKADGNQTKAAKLLKLGRTCLIAKMKKYGLVDTEA